MAYSEPVVICKKHPQHKQQPGVCSCCLREKLSKINGTTTTIASTIASITSSLSSSTSSSNCASPHGGAGHRRITSDSAGGHYSFVTRVASLGGGGGLKKSRSITIVARGGRIGINGKKKKEGFWSKLIRSTGKRTNRVVVH